VVALFAMLTAATAHADTTTLAKEVSKARGLPIKKPIAQATVTREELRARLVKLAGEKKTQDELRAEGVALARWGLIPPDTDYVALMVDLLSEQIAGYYDPDTKQLTLLATSGKAPLWDELVLAHEVVHALQDQSYDLTKFEDVPSGEGDAAQARHALVEGDGITLMFELLLARKGITPPWDSARLTNELAHQMDLPMGDALDKAPLAIREMMLFPYRAGFTFVTTLRATKPWSAIDAAFKRPPKSTEQIIHPEKYLADEEPVTVKLELPDLVHTTVWGELGFELFLRAHGIDAATAKLAAAGWGGDRVVATASFGAAKLVWDSEIDAIEAYDAAQRALDDTTYGAVAMKTDVITQWLAIDGTVTFIERQGTHITMAIGGPATQASELAERLRLEAPEPK
jgi:hypothetical protein